MHWTPAFNRNRSQIGQIVLRLLALAVLAERAVERSLAVQINVFWLLNRAEFAATALFIDLGGEFNAQALWDAPLDLPDNDDALRAALIRLAFSFRAMAAMLAPCQPTPAIVPGTGDPIRHAALVLRLCARRLSAPRANDTS